jgi:hypothetical protein
MLDLELNGAAASRGVERAVGEPRGARLSGFIAGAASRCAPRSSEFAQVVQRDLGLPPWGSSSYAVRSMRAS